MRYPYACSNELGGNLGLKFLDVLSLNIKQVFTYSFTFMLAVVFSCSLLIFRRNRTVSVACAIFARSLAREHSTVTQQALPKIRTCSSIERVQNALTAQIGQARNVRDLIRM